jgi:hypothetical protein
MLRSIFIVTVIFLSACSSVVPNAPTRTDSTELTAQANFWFQMNGALETDISGSPTSVDIAKDANENFYVSFLDTSNGLLVKRWTPSTQTWVQVGGSVDTQAYNAGSPVQSLAIDNSGNPVVAYIKTQSGIYRLFVKRWDGSTWQTVGGTANANTTQYAYYPSLALDSSGNPYVAFRQSASGGGYNLFVRRWNGTAWETVGPGSLDVVATNDVYYPSLEVYNNQPIVSWYETNGNIYVKQWDGANWVRLATRVNTTDRSGYFYTSLAMTSSGTPVVAYVEYSSTSNLYEVRAKQWNGTTWTQLGSTANNPGFTCSSCQISMTLDNTGKPTVVFDQYDWNLGGNVDRYVKQWNGSTWAQVGDVLEPSGQDIAELSPVVLDKQNRPVVALLESTNSNGYNLYVKRYLTNAFAPLGSALDITRANQAIDPTIATQGSTTMAAWSENGGVYVKNYTGTTWQTVVGAVDNDGSPDTKPDLALDDSGIPYVAWLEFDGTNYQTFVKVRSGATWLALGGALGAGTPSTYPPSIAYDTERNVPVVAFTDNDGTTDNILVKRWNPDSSSWDTLGGTLTNMNSPSLAVDGSGNPVMAWTRTLNGQSDVYVMRWDGAAWLSLGGSLDRRASSNATAPALALDNTGNPYVVWQEAFVNPGSTSEDIYVKRWDGTAWQALGLRLDRRSTNNAVAPSISIDNANNPVVAWQETFQGNEDVFLTRWNGTAWTLVGGNALDVVRVSASSSPDVALGSTGEPIVIWQELGASSDVFVKGY